MYNLNLISERLNIIRSAVKRLRLLAQIPEKEFCGNEDYVDIAENRLRRALEALFDLGRHLVVKAGSGLPSDYRSVINLLSEGKVIPDQFASQISGMTGYRNRLIHDYNKVTPEELYQILQHRLPDFEQFCRHVAEYLQAESMRG